MLVMKIIFQYLGHRQLNYKFLNANPEMTECIASWNVLPYVKLLANTREIYLYCEILKHYKYRQLTVRVAIHLPVEGQFSKSPQKLLCVKANRGIFYMTATCRSCV